MKLGTEKPFGDHIDYEIQDRSRHLYIIGQTGTGKSTLLANLIAQDIENDEGICVIDIHGSLSEDILTLIPLRRRKDLIYFNVSNTDWPIGFNVLDDVETFLDTFKYLFRDEW